MQSVLKKDASTRTTVMETITDELFQREPAMEAQQMQHAYQLLANNNINMISNGL